MKRTVFLALLFVSLSSAAATFPPLEEVARRFAGTYRFTSTRSFIRPGLARKPDGWHILHIVPMYYPQVEKDELFWSVEKNDYLPLEYPEGPGPEHDEMLDMLLNENTQATADLHKYFGYDGWARDIVKEQLPDSARLSAKELSPLGSACLFYAREFVLERQGMFSSGGAKDAEGLSSGERLAQFNKYMKAGLSMMRRFRRQAADSLHLMPELMFGSFVMNYQLMCDLLRQAETANALLKERLFTPFERAYGANLLSTCDSGAILFVKASEDMHIARYLQAAEKFREDVRIVCIDLLDEPKYVQRLILGEKNDPLRTIITPLVYEDKAADLLEWVPAAEPAPAPEVPDFLRRSFGSQTEFGNARYGTFSDTVLKLTLDLRALPPALFAGYDRTRFDSVLTLDIGSANLVHSQLLFIDLLAANFSSRPIYMAPGMNSYLFMARDYLWIEGLALRFTPERHRKSQKLFEMFNRAKTDIAYDKMQRFRWEGNASDILGYREIVKTYKLFGLSVARQLNEEGKKEKGIKLLDKITSAYPSHPSYCENLDSYIATTYYWAGYSSKANAVAKLYLQAATRDMAVLLKQIEIPYLREEYNFCRSRLMDIRNASRTYGELQITQQAENLLIKYPIK